MQSGDGGKKKEARGSLKLGSAEERGKEMAAQAECVPRLLSRG